MKKDILNAPFIGEMMDMTANMYRLGWDERNGGNISYILAEKELVEYLDLNSVIRSIPMGFTAPKELLGKYILVTGTGKYFKNVEKNPEANLGIVKIGENSAELIWGFNDGGRFTSEFPAHLMSHAARLSADSEHRIVMHCHPTYTIAMNTICPVDEADFTHRLWQINTESIVVFPDGIGMLPWMICGTNDIGSRTAEKMREYRLVVWTNHGIYGTGRSLDEAFGLIETVEKGAQIYMLTEGSPRHLITDEQLLSLAANFNVQPRKGVIGK